MMDMNLNPIIPWNTALGYTTSRDATKRRVYEIVERLRSQDAGRVRVLPPVNGGTVLVTLAFVWQDDGEQKLGTLVLTPGFPVEVYDTGAQSGTRISIGRLAARVDRDYRNGWT